MSFVVVAFTVASAVALAAIGWLVLKPLPKEASAGLVNNIEELLPLHSRHFPQVRQALASADAQYVRRRASQETERMWREERRRILRSFLDGLAEDFARLDRLSRMVASLSPRFSRREEIERAWLSLRFRLNYRMTVLRISLGGPGSASQVSHMTELVANLSSRAEAAMTRLEVASSGRIG